MIPPTAVAAPETVSQPAVPRRRSLFRRLFGWLFKGLFFFVVGSILWVLLYRFVNPPITFTQMGDLIGGNGVTSAWRPIGEIDRNMVRAAIAGEDARFCSHYGFDPEAIEAAWRRNQAARGVKRGGS
ncbi:MAG: transglycosylase domain-containing protein, partial [Allosphingosinicella sp.]